MKKRTQRWLGYGMAVLGLGTLVAGTAIPLGNALHHPKTLDHPADLSTFPTTDTPNPTVLTSTTTGTSPTSATIPANELRVNFRNGTTNTTPGYAGVGQIITAWWNTWYAANAQAALTANQNPLQTFLHTALGLTPDAGSAYADVLDAATNPTQARNLTFAIVPTLIPTGTNARGGMLYTAQDAVQIRFNGKTYPATVSPGSAAFIPNGTVWHIPATVYTSRVVTDYIQIPNQAGLSIQGMAFRVVYGTPNHLFLQLALESVSLASQRANFQLGNAVVYQGPDFVGTTTTPDTAVNTFLVPTQNALSVATINRITNTFITNNRWSRYLIPAVATPGTQTAFLMTQTQVAKAWTTPPNAQVLAWLNRTLFPDGTYVITNYATQTTQNPDAIIINRVAIWNPAMASGQVFACPLAQDGNENPGGLVTNGAGNGTTPNWTGQLVLTGLIPAQGQPTVSGQGMITVASTNPNGSQNTGIRYQFAPTVPNGFVPPEWNPGVFLPPTCYEQLTITTPAQTSAETTLKVGQPFQFGNSPTYSFLELDANGVIVAGNAAESGTTGGVAIAPNTTLTFVPVTLSQFLTQESITLGGQTLSCAKLAPFVPGNATPGTTLGGLLDAYLANPQNLCPTGVLYIAPYGNHFLVLQGGSQAPLGNTETQGSDVPNIALPPFQGALPQPSRPDTSVAIAGTYAQFLALVDNATGGTTNPVVNPYLATVLTRWIQNIFDPASGQTTPPPHQYLYAPTFRTRVLETLANALAGGMTDSLTLPGTMLSQAYTGNPDITWPGVGETMTLTFAQPGAAVQPVVYTNQSPGMTVVAPALGTGTAGTNLGSAQSPNLSQLLIGTNAALTGPYALSGNAGGQNPFTTADFLSAIQTQADNPQVLNFLAQILNQFVAQFRAQPCCVTGYVVQDGRVTQIQGYQMATSTAPGHFFTWNTNLIVGSSITQGLSITRLSQPFQNWVNQINNSPHNAAEVVPADIFAGQTLVISAGNDPAIPTPDPAIINYVTTTYNGTTIPGLVTRSRMPTIAGITTPELMNFFAVFYQEGMAKGVNPFATIQNLVINNENLSQMTAGEFALIGQYFPNLTTLTITNCGLAINNLTLAPGKAASTTPSSTTPSTTPATTTPTATPTPVSTSPTSTPTPTSTPAKPGFRALQVLNLQNNQLTGQLTLTTPVANVLVGQNQLTSLTINTGTLQTLYAPDNRLTTVNPAVSPTAAQAGNNGDVALNPAFTTLNLANNALATFNAVDWLPENPQHPVTINVANNHILAYNFSNIGQAYQYDATQSTPARIVYVRNVGGGIDNTQTPLATITCGGQVVSATWYVQTTPTFQVANPNLAVPVADTGITGLDLANYQNPEMYSGMYNSRTGWVNRINNVVPTGNTNGQVYLTRAFVQQSQITLSNGLFQATINPSTFHNIYGGIIPLNIASAAAIIQNEGLGPVAEFNALNNNFNLSFEHFVPTSTVNLPPAVQQWLQNRVATDGLNDWVAQCPINRLIFAHINGTTSVQTVQPFQNITLTLTNQTNGDIIRFNLTSQPVPETPTVANTPTITTPNFLGTYGIGRIWADNGTSSLYNLGQSGVLTPLAENPFDLGIDQGLYQQFLAIKYANVPTSQLLVGNLSADETAFDTAVGKTKAQTAWNTFQNNFYTLLQREGILRAGQEYSVFGNYNPHTRQFSISPFLLNDDAISLQPNTPHPGGIQAGLYSSSANWTREQNAGNDFYESPEWANFLDTVIGQTGAGQPQTVGNYLLAHLKNWNYEMPDWTTIAQNAALTQAFNTVFGTLFNLPANFTAAQFNQAMAVYFPQTTTTYTADQYLNGSVVGQYYLYHADTPGGIVQEYALALNYNDVYSNTANNGYTFGEKIYTFRTFMGVQMFNNRQNLAYSNPAVWFKDPGGTIPTPYTWTDLKQLEAENLMPNGVWANPVSAQWIPNPNWAKIQAQENHQKMVVDTSVSVLTVGLAVIIAVLIAIIVAKRVRDTEQTRRNYAKAKRNNTVSQLGKEYDSFYQE